MMTRQQRSAAPGTPGEAWSEEAITVAPGQPIYCICGKSLAPLPWTASPTACGSATIPLPCRHCKRLVWVSLFLGG
jgi:hypothetical protein